MVKMGKIVVKDNHFTHILRSFGKMEILLTSEKLTIPLL